MGFIAVSFLAAFFVLFLPVEAKRLNIAISSVPVNLNPFFSTDANSQNIGRLLHLSLVDVNRKMEIVCRLCHTYYERREGEAHVVRFVLKRDRFFWDGTPIEARHVKDSWSYYKDGEEIKSVFRFAFSSIDNVRILGRWELEFVFRRFALENLSNLVLLKILKMKGGEIVGAGPYRLERQNPLRFDLRPRDKRHRSLSFKVIKDETTLALKLINGEIDLSLSGMSPRKYKWLKEKGQKDLRFFEISGSNYVYININHKQIPFNDRRIRKALSLLIPRRDILKYKLHGTAVLAKGLFSPAFTSLVDSSLLLDDYDPREAFLLLGQAGFRLNDSGWLERKGEILHIDWKVSNNRASVEMVETIRHYYRKHGIRIHVSIQEWGAFMSSFKKGNYDLIMGQWVGFTGPDMLEYVFHSRRIPPKGGNRGGYGNRKVDEYLDLASREPYKKKRDNLYKMAHREANLDYAYLNLWHPHIIWMAQKCIGDLLPFPNGSFLPLLEIMSTCGGMGEKF